MNLPAFESPVVPLTMKLPTPPSVRLPVIHRALMGAQVWHVELTYEYRGKFGAHHLKLTDRHRRDTSWIRIDRSAHENLERFLMQLVRERYPRWDTGAGSQGVIAWDLQTDSIRHFHHELVVDVKTSLIEGM